MNKGQGHNLNKLGRGPPGDATKLPNIKALGLVGSDNFFFHVFPIKAYVKHVTRGASPFFAPLALFEQTW